MSDETKERDIVERLEAVAEIPTLNIDIAVLMREAAALIRALDEAAENALSGRVWAVSTSDIFHAAAARHAARTKKNVK